MTKKHFDALAKQLALVRPDGTSETRYNQWLCCVIAVVQACRVHNPAFSAERFRKACEEVCNA